MLSGSTFRFIALEAFSAANCNAASVLFASKIKCTASMVASLLASCLAHSCKEQAAFIIYNNYIKYLHNVFLCSSL